MSTEKKIAVMTSGGDAPGMNAAVRGVLRSAQCRGWQVFGIRDAYRGMVAGADCIVRLHTGAIGASFREGGTFLGSARDTAIAGNSKEARALKVRALDNVRKLGISGLVVIGGDGSLTGALALHEFLKNHGPEFPELDGMQLQIVGLPGSIDNDIPCTDMAIGVDTTLNTVVDCIDKLRDTATSHKRVSIVEVMGRLRGYLAVMSGLATGADHIFIREHRAGRQDLLDMLSELQQSFALGQQAGVIVRSEGAEFSTAFIRESIAHLLEMPRDVRETILGHLQRGGAPTAYERVLAMRLGSRAVEILGDINDEPLFVGISANIITENPIAEVLEKKNAPAFHDTLSPGASACYDLASRLESPVRTTAQGRTKKIAILTDGNNVSGMNMAVRSVARLALDAGMAVEGLRGGFDGLESGGKTLPLSWDMLEMKSILRRPGSLLGVSRNDLRYSRERVGRLAEGVDRMGIDGLVTVGSLESYHVAAGIAQHTDIPIVGIPADANCNLPGTNWVIGMDSAFNDLCRGIDRAADTAHVQKKTFIIHLKWHYCYCLVHMAALAGGADQLIIDARETVDDSSDALKRQIEKKVKALQNTVARGKTGTTIVFFSRRLETADSALVLINEAIVEAELGGPAPVIPLETSYGGSVPTAFDRVLASRFGEAAFNLVQDQLGLSNTAFHIVGLTGKDIRTHRYKEHVDGIDNGCPPEFVAELQRCFALMSQASASQAVGGTVRWSSGADVRAGMWKCSQCGHEQAFTITSGSGSAFACRREGCTNYACIIAPGSAGRASQ
jgi:6-phosphofructokinase 1